jgi:hypothetical protein
MIFSCNPHWIEEICDTPANYWLDETPKAERDFKAKLIGTEGARLLREKRVQGRPHMRKHRGRTSRGKRVPEVEINVYKRRGVDL